MYLQRTSWALNLFLGSRVSILQTRSLALSEILGQGSDSKSSLPRRICLKIPASVSERRKSYNIMESMWIWSDKRISWFKWQIHYLPKMGAHHKAKCTELLLRSTHQLLDHSISEAPLVQHSMDFQRHQRIYHLGKWKRAACIIKNLSRRGHWEHQYKSQTEHNLECKYHCTKHIKIVDHKSPSRNHKWLLVSFY